MTSRDEYGRLFIPDWDKQKPAPTPWMRRWLWRRRCWVESRKVYKQADAWDVAYGAGRWVCYWENRPCEQASAPPFSLKRLFKEPDDSPTLLAWSIMVALSIIIMPLLVMWPTMVTMSLD